MRKDNWKKASIALGVVVLFILIILIVFQFQHKSEEITINEPNLLTEEEIVFENNSDYTEKEIRTTTESIRQSLKELLTSVEYYKISEINSLYKPEDDEKYIVIPETFFKSLRELVTEEFYLTYWNQATPITKDENLAIDDNLYQVPISIFDEAYSHSAIAVNDVNTEELVLKSATNERIEASEKIKICDEESICARDDEYNLVLEKEANTWKIAQIN